MTMFYFVMQNSMFFMIPLLIVALGGLFSEKSGIVNIALEGKMVMGAFTGIMFMRTVQGAEYGFFSIFSQPTVLLFSALFIAMITGIGISVFHAYASINLNANQIISGVISDVSEADTHIYHLAGFYYAISILVMIFCLRQ